MWYAPDCNRGCAQPIPLFRAAPGIPARPRQELVASLPAYHRGNTWGIGADVLRTANDVLTNDWTPAKADCDRLTGSAKEEACRRFERARKNLNDVVGYIDIVRRYASRLAAWINGKIAADGAPGEVLRDPLVVKSVIGG